MILLNYYVEISSKPKVISNSIDLGEFLANVPIKNVLINLFLIDCNFIPKYLATSM